MTTQLQASVSPQRLVKLLLAPYTSEKSTLIADKNKQFVFKVAHDATKPEIKLAVEHFFSVKVKAVQICNVHGKTRNFRQRAGKTKGFKKAYVALQQGYDIDFTGNK